MRRFCILGCLLCALVACANQSAPSQAQIEAHDLELKEQSRSKTVNIVQEPYLGARTQVREDLGLSPVLSTRVVLRSRGTLQDMATRISEMVPLSVQVALGDDPDSASKLSAGIPDPSDPSLQGLLALPPVQGSGPVVNVSYEGTLRGLFDHIATLSGYGWDLDAKNNAVTFSPMQVRTFTLTASPGKVTYDNQITNKSKESSASGLGGGAGVNQTVSTADTSAQTAQTNTTTLSFDIWSESEKGVKALLSSKGSVTGNQGAGTLTVRDTPNRLRQVAAFVDDLNTRLGRQVALTVYVWSLELNDDAEAGIDLQALFQSPDVSVVTGGLGNLDAAGSLTATILNGKLKNSKGILKALKQWGTATQVTSAGGIIMNNQSLPVLAIKRHGYLAGVSSTTNDYGQTAQLTPGEVTTGFAMTVLPHILDKRRVILQYNINLSSLDDIVEFNTADVTVQLPQVSTRSFAQRMSLKMGQTLVLAGFEQETQRTGNSLGIFGGGRTSGYGKTLLVITIELESTEV